MTVGGGRPVFAESISRFDLLISKHGPMGHSMFSLSATNYGATNRPYPRQLAALAFTDAFPVGEEWENGTRVSFYFPFFLPSFFLLFFYPNRFQWMRISSARSFRENGIATEALRIRSRFSARIEICKYATCFVSSRRRGCLADFETRAME